MKIANKISLSFLLTAFILTIIATSYTYINVSRDIQSNILTHIAAVNYAKARHIDTFLKEKKNFTMQLSQNLLLENLLLANGRETNYSVTENLALRLLNKTKLLTDDIYEISVIDKNGKIIISTDENKIGLEASNDPYFIEAQKSTFIKDVYFSKIMQKITMAFSTPVRNIQTGEFLGVVVNKVGLKNLNSLVTDVVGLGRSGETFLVNKEGYMITPSRFVNDTVLNLKIGAGMLEECFGEIDEAGKEHIPFIYINYRGVKCLGTHRHINETSWCLFTEIAAMEVFAPVRKFKIIMTAIIVIIPICAWLMGVFISHILTGPIRKLREGMSIVGRGNLDYEVVVQTTDEIGILSEEFDRMVENLKQTTTSRNELAKEVAKRSETEKNLKKAYEELKNAHAKLAQADKMQLIGTLASGIAHEVKNPLAIIAQSADYIIRRLDVKDKTVLASYGYIRDAILRATNIVNGLLDLARTSDKMDIAPSNINVIMGRALLLIKNDITMFNIHVITELIKDIPNVNVDRNRIEQVFINLLLNAIHAMPDGGQLKIITSTAKFAEEREAVVVEIEDTGPGIPDDMLAKLFTPFFTTKYKKGGTGLGLSIVKNIMDLHNAKIKIQNKKEGHGAVATLIFNIDKQKEAGGDEEKDIGG